MDTIFAPSTAAGQAGIAVIRLSGPAVRDVLKSVCHMNDPKPRYAAFSGVFTPDGDKIDEAVVLFFKGPNSFTGEDVAEIQCHGSRAVLKEILAVLSTQPTCRMAEPGEFTKRAVYNQKMDLTAAEGLIDLIHADTQAQRRWAVRQMGGALQKIYDGWRNELVQALALMEAYIDFPEEEIPDSQLDDIRNRTYNVITQLEQHLDDKGRGKRLKDGFSIVLVGAPNVGKSSLMNQLAKRDVAIVSSTAGTTRDIVEVSMDVAGYPVILADTAGLRETTEEIEGIGIQRALNRIREADFVIAVGDARDYPQIDATTRQALAENPHHIVVWNKCDLVSQPLDGICLCAPSGKGLDALWNHITQVVVDVMGNGSEVMLTRERYKTALTDCLASLKRSLTAPALELQAEDLRLAANALGKITGRVQVSELFDIIFSTFCIGK